MVSTQEHLLLRDQLDKYVTKPRQQFLEDLVDFVDTKIGEGHKIILMLDANEDLEDNGPWREFVEKCNLFNLMERQKEKNPVLPSREESNRRIDHTMSVKSYSLRGYRSSKQ